MPQQTTEKTDRDVTVTVLAPNGSPLSLSCKLVFKVEHLLKDAARRFTETGQVMANQEYQLAFQGRSLDGKSTLADEGVHDGATLNLRTMGVPSDG